MDNRLIFLYRRVSELRGRRTEGERGMKNRVQADEEDRRKSLCQIRGCDVDRT